MKEGFTKSLCRPSAFNQREYATAAICKPYIFHWSDLLNTEIIITTFPKPLIKSAHSVGTFERQFNIGCIRSEEVKLSNSSYGLNNHSGGVSNGRLKETSICDNHFAALSGNGGNDQKIVFIAGFLTPI